MCSTFWYLSAAPELLSLAAARLDAEGALKAAQLNVEFTHVIAPIAGGLVVAIKPGGPVLAGALAIAIAVGTIAGHALRVARSNPIHALRYE